MTSAQPKAEEGVRVRAPYGSSSNRRSLRKAETMRRLIEAGRSLFSELGYEATKIEDIAAAAGVSRAAFYLHFKSKFDIIRALREDIGETLLGSYAALADLGPSPSLDQVAEWVRQFMRICHGNGATLLMLQRSVPADEEAFDEIAFYDEAMAILACSYPRFATTRSDPAARAEAQLFFFQLEVLIRQMFAAGKRLAWNEIYKLTARNFLTFIHG